MLDGAARLKDLVKSCEQMGMRALAITDHGNLFGAHEWYATAKGSSVKPIIGLERGLTDPVTDLNMGQTAEVIAHLMGITREQADAYAVESHRRLAYAQAQGHLKDEVETAFDRKGRFYDHDDGVRPVSDASAHAHSVERLIHRIEAVASRLHHRS